ncbi:hypothetical protein [Pseudidiomarina terrestris]|uniref:hypothetical protein n=1 Tax=Pseudidiomarina terrestris TaxID=2820060 RepID=UPI00264C7F23|nr:hypothetical protein [Pseudidiomarina sp. 1ASP75-5]MDN7135359.1 hypothetical protein [Pseudidiomarina sp. 1ASP75-5]
MLDIGRSETHKKVTPGVALAIVLVGYLFLHDAFLTLSDIFLLLLVIGNWVLLSWIIFSLRSGLRSVVKVNFNADSLPYRWFNKNGIVQIIVSVGAALMFALGFVIILKSFTLQHSFLILALAVLIAGWVTGLFRNKPMTSTNLGYVMNDPEAKKVMASVFSIFVNLTVFTIVLAAVTSAKDTHMFFVNDAAFGNFSEIAHANAIAETGANDFGRALVNMSLILDAFRQATINEFFSAVGLQKDSAKYFWFFGLIFFFNFFKFLSFSAAFVLITLSAKNHILDKVTIWMSQALDKSWNYAQKGTAKLKSIHDNDATKK